MIKITFPDGSVKEFESGINSEKIAETISSSLAKKCIIAKVNGELYDLSREICEDASFELLTNVSEYHDLLNHSCAHLLAWALKELYPHAMFGVGPAIEEGFYYDVDLGDVKLTEEDLPKIEKKMAALVASGHRKTSEIPREDIQKYLSILSPEDVEAVRKLSVILQIAESFDRSQSSVVTGIDCDVLGDSVIVKTQTEGGDCSLEIKDALHAAPEFKAAYGKNLEIL